MTIAPTGSDMSSVASQNDVTVRDQLAEHDGERQIEWRDGSSLPTTGHGLL